MKGTLENLKASLPSLKMKDAKELLKSVNEWYGNLEPLEYPCFGCKYCIPPEAMTILTKKYPSLASSTLSSCEITVSSNSWPPVEGEYTVLDKSAPVAVSTLASVKLEEKLVKNSPPGLCIVGKTETENIGVDKIIKNIVSNPAISALVIAGNDADGHKSGQTLLALSDKGVDKDMRVVGSKGRRPILKNVTASDVTAFRNQVEVVDMIGCENTRTLKKVIRELSEKAGTRSSAGCGCSDSSCKPQIQPVKIPISLGLASGVGRGNALSDNQRSNNKVPKITVKKHSKKVKLDRAGYFVILPSRKTGSILVEHYSYDNKLLRKIEGKKCRDIYFIIINNKWVTELSHAAYLGRELEKAELSIKKGFKFVQDGA
jgi:tetrahydromethanopterin S-methyltransferase subunit A